MRFFKTKISIDRRRPTIGITGPDEGGGAAWFFTALGVRLAGGKPVRITPGNPRTADGLQGLIIGGGADIDPRAWEEDHVVEEYLARTIRHPRKGFFWKLRRFIRWSYYPFLFLLRKLLSRSRGWTLDRDRDHLEFQLIDQAVKKELPILGICRGSQLMNVYFGGDLYEEISPFYLEEPNPSSVFPVKKVFIKPGSKLGTILQRPQLKVNALHHQAIRVAGTDIEIVAREANQVVQGIESRAMAFALGVQWHPEYLPQRAEQRRIFQALVEQARHVNSQIEAQDMQDALQSPRAASLVQLEAREEAALRHWEGGADR